MSASSPVGAATQRRRATDRRFLHDNETVALERLDEPLGGDPSHIFVCVMHALAAAVSQRKCERVGDVLRFGERGAEVQVEPGTTVASLPKAR